VEDRLPRKLKVILHADVAGYSRLACSDEDATHRRLKESLELIDNLVSSYHGRIVNTAGDAVLAMFEAVVDAVSCAVAIQHDLTAKNMDIPDDRKVQFRIGVNLGDVIEDGGDIYGDGVNVAARLEGLAEAGGICISEQVYMAVEGKLALDYYDIGAQAVKNIAKPVQTYRTQLKPGIEPPPPSEHRNPVEIFSTRRQSVLAMLGIILVIIGGVLAWLKPWQLAEEPASAKRVALPLPDNPSIAVLPFNNLSGDPEKDYFVDGFTEDIITDLSKFSELFVIAKSSTFTYKNKDVKVEQVAEELGVRYVLDGSVRMTETDLLVTTQLINATSGKNIWAERYERPLAEFHIIQSDVLENIVAAVAERVENSGLRIASRKQTENLNAYEHVLKGYDLVFRWNKENNEQARIHFERAIELDPFYARAFSGLAFTHNIDFGRGWSADLEESLDKARKAGLQAIALDGSDNRPRIVLGWAYINGGQLDKGVAEINKGIKLNPNDAGVLARSGYALIYYGEFQQAVDQTERAMRINPFHPEYYFDVLAWAQYFLQRYDDALRTMNHVAEPNMAGHRTLAAIYARLGKLEKAQHHAKKVLELDPEFALSNYAKSQPFKYSEHLNFHLESLRLAGLH
jgi:adenylate cyclase